MNSQLQQAREPCSSRKRKKILSLFSNIAERLTGWTDFPPVFVIFYKHFFGGIWTDERAARAAYSITQNQT